MDCPDTQSAHTSQTVHRRLPLRHCLCYGMGYLSVALTTDMTLTWLLKRYRPDPADLRWDVLVTASAFAVAMLIGRLVDALADPLVGFYSDRIKTRWGRRKPFLAVGAPLLAASFALLWLPPTPTLSTINGIHLAVTASLFLFAFTVVVTPYLAMLPEIASHPRERVRLTAWQGGFNVLGAIGGMVLAGYLIDHYGYRTMALFFAPLICISAWMPLLVPVPKRVAAPVRFSFMKALISTVQNPHFRPYLLGQLFFWMSLRIVLGTLPKFVEVRTGAQETVQGMIMAVGMVMAAIFLPFMPAVVMRVGKKRMLVGSMAYFAGLMPLLLLVGQPFGGLSGVYQAGLIMLLAGPVIATLFTIPNAIMADIADQDEKRTGYRREAIYYGAQGLITKAGMGIGIAIAALQLDFFGETAAHQGGFTATMLTAMLFSLAAAFVMSRYPGK